MTMTPTTLHMIGTALFAMAALPALGASIRALDALVAHDRDAPAALSPERGAQ